MKTPPSILLLRKLLVFKRVLLYQTKLRLVKLTRAQLEEIATTKEPDLTGADLDARVRTIAGSAPMGLEVEL